MDAARKIWHLIKADDVSTPTMRAAERPMLAAEEHARKAEELIGMRAGKEYPFTFTPFMKQWRGQGRRG